MINYTKLDIPAFDAWAGNGEPANANVFVLSGGGGKAKSGVGNTVSLCTLGARKDAKQKGVDVHFNATLNTGDVLADSCCMVTRDVIAYSSDETVFLSRLSDGSKLSEVASTNVATSIHIIRSYMNRWLVVGGNSGMVKVFEYVEGSIPSLKEAFTFDRQRDTIKDISFVQLTKDVTLLATASEDSTVRVYNLATGKAEGILPADMLAKNIYRGAQFSGKDPFVIKLFTLQCFRARPATSTVVVWERSRQLDKPDWVLSQVERVYDMLGSAIAVCPDEALIAVAANEAVLILDEDTLAKRRVIPKAHLLPISSLFFANNFVVSVSPDKACAMTRFDDLLTVDIVGFCIRLVKFLTFLFTMFLFFTLLFVSRNVKGADAREHFWDALLRSDASMNISSIDADRIQRFVVDFFYS